MDCPLTDDQMEDLFSNIEDIYHFNSKFLRELELCGLDPVLVARCFVRNNDGFSIYTEYCTNYPRTVSVLTELMRQEAVVRLFRERQVALHHTLPLGSYLLKPVQRILKYHLLLQNIVKQSTPENAGYSDIVTALSTMTAIAHHINEMKRKHEHAVRVQEIQSLLLGWEGEDLTTFGELCAEGTFRVSGAKALRHVFLFDQILLITKKKEEGILGYKAHIMCSNLMLIESVPGEPLSFHVIPFDNPRLQYTLQARNLEQKREWTLQLKRVILENYNAVIPSHARQLVMQLGQNRTDGKFLPSYFSTFISTF
ncbi:Pleckstrin y domain-containing G member 1 [Homalodisca vitripennis]|nr:Pleckstrin y domain-containing G member 1 [Homalodisca vitripennis]